MLEQIAYESPRFEQGQQTYFAVGDLENLSASALYYGKGGSPLGSLGSFGIVKTPLMAGTSSFSVSLPASNSTDKGVKISTPQETVIVNPYKRIEGKSGIDYFNLLDNSLAGRIENLNLSEIMYLKIMGKKD